MVKITDFKLLKLAKYFIVNKGYKLIITSTHNNEILLESLDKQKHQIIFLSSKVHFDQSQILNDIEKVKNIVAKIKAKTFKKNIDFTLMYTSEFQQSQEVPNVHFLNGKQQFHCQNLLLEFPDLNTEIIVEETENNNQAAFNDHIREIYTHTERKYTAPKEAFYKNKFNANNIFIILIIALNISIMFIPSTLGLFSGHSLESVYNFIGASSFEMVYINGQLWRPLISGLTAYQPISLMINIYFFYHFGQMINMMYGNFTYFFIMIGATYFTGLLASLVFPGFLILGTASLFAITFGASIHYAQNNRISFIKNYSRLTRHNLFLLSISLIFSKRFGLSILLFSILFGYLFSFVISAAKETEVWNTITSASVILSILAFSIFGWQRLPKQPTGVYGMQKNHFKIYEDFGFGISKIKYEQNICNFYELKGNACIFNEKEIKKENKEA